MDKIRAYVNSIDPSASNYVDKDVLLAVAEHHCLHGEKRIFEVFKSLPSKASVFLSGEEVKAVNLAVRISEENGLGFEEIHLADSGLMPKLEVLSEKMEDFSNHF